MQGVLAASPVCLGLSLPFPLLLLFIPYHPRPFFFLFVLYLVGPAIPLLLLPHGAILSSCLSLICVCMFLVVDPASPSPLWSNWMSLGKLAADKGIYHDET